MSKPSIHTVVGSLAAAAELALSELKDEPWVSSKVAVSSLKRAIALYEAYCGGPADDLEAALRASLTTPTERPPQ